MDEMFPEGMLADIEQVLDTVKNQSRGRDTYDEVFRSNLMFPLQRRAELAAMMRKAREINPTTVMEIGADKGGGLLHWIMSLPTVQRVIACEIRGLPYKNLFEAAFPDIQFLWLECSSYDLTTIRDVNRFLDRKPVNAHHTGWLDCLFIDGDKSRYLSDYANYVTSVRRPGGRVFMHDITDEGPGAAFQLACKGRKCERIIDTSDSVAAAARAGAGRPPDAGPYSAAYEGWLRHWGGRSCGVGMIEV